MLRICLRYRTTEPILLSRYIGFWAFHKINRILIRLFWNFSQIISDSFTIRRQLSYLKAAPPLIIRLAVLHKLKQTHLLGLVPLLLLILLMSSLQNLYLLLPKPLQSMVIIQGKWLQAVLAILHNLLLQPFLPLFFLLRTVLLFQLFIPFFLIRSMDNGDSLPDILQVLKQIPALPAFGPDI